MLATSDTEASQVVTEADLSVLRTLNLPSGYQGVYQKERGKSNIWLAMPYNSHGGLKGDYLGRAGMLGKRVRIGGFKHPRDAAKAVVRWWKEHFGPDWVAAFRRRTHNPWWCRRVADGWEVVIRMGEAERVLPGTHPTRQDASDHFRQWAKLTYGEHAWLRLRRG